MEDSFNTSDKAARQYCISIDWLSVSCRDMGFVFWNKETQPSGYRLVRMGHGSKVFAELYDVYDTDGVHVAELHAKPYNKGMDKHTIILKADNALLYLSNGIEQFFSCVNALALYYKGINRLDICCDQNEFYNGYLPTSLINQYLDTSNPILKLGINHGFTHFDKGIYSTATGNGLTLWSKIPLVKKEQREKRTAEIAARNEELKKAGLPLLDTTEAHALETPPESLTDSITWGNRGCAVQAQIYNKTRELQEKVLKHYIVDAWKAAGLDVSRDIYRVELRIMGKGKGLINPETGKQFELHLIDLLSQKAIEELFFAYAEKYFKFYRNDGHIKIRQCQPIKLWHRRPPILKPKQRKNVKNPTRFTLLMANSLNKEVLALKQQAAREKAAFSKTPDGEYVYRQTEKLAHKIGAVVDYFKDAYNIGSWLEYHQLEEKIEQDSFMRPLDPKVRTTTAWTLTNIAQELLEKINLRAIKVKEAQSRIGYDWKLYAADIANIPPESVFAYQRAVVQSLDTLTYVEYAHDTNPAPPQEDTEPIPINWDNL